MTPRRALRAQYPYEARIVGGKVMMPAELQRLHRDLLDPSRLDVISDDMRQRHRLNGIEHAFSPTRCEPWP
jgi:hypothetical protein